MPPTALPPTLLCLTLTGLCVGVVAFVLEHKYIIGTTVLGLGGIKAVFLAAGVFGRENLASPCIASLCAVALIWASVHYGRQKHWRASLSLLWSLTWAAMSTTIGCSYWAEYLDSNRRLIKLATTWADISWCTTQVLIVATAISVVIALVPRNKPTHKSASRSNT